MEEEGRKNKRKGGRSKIEKIKKCTKERVSE